MKSGVSFRNVATCMVPGEEMSEAALTPRRMKELDELCSRLGLNCGRMCLVNEALTHSSHAVENTGLKDYEKLEFFGDAVLKFVVSEYLLDRFPTYMEGQLTEIRAVLVSDKVLAEIAREINLDKYILLGRQVQMRPSIMADCLEALIGAAYQDLGLFPVQNLIVRLFGSHATEVDRDGTYENHKAILQEYTQGRAQGLPIYTVLNSEGPAHEPTFTIAVSIAGDAIATGTGPSKKQAEQEAARLAFEKLKEQEF